MLRWFWLGTSATWMRREWCQWIAAGCWRNSWVSREDVTSSTRTEKHFCFCSHPWLRSQNGWCVDCRCFDVSRRCSFQVLNSLKPAPKTTSMWSRPSNASSTSSATRCPRAWTAIQLSLQERPAPNSRTALRRSSSPGATVSDWWWRRVAGGQCCSCTAVQCTEFCSFSIITPAPAAFELQLKPSWVVDSLSCSLYHIISQVNKKKNKTEITLVKYHRIFRKTPYSHLLVLPCDGWGSK